MRTEILGHPGREQRPDGLKERTMEPDTLDPEEALKAAEAAPPDLDAEHERKKATETSSIAIEAARRADHAKAVDDHAAALGGRDALAKRLAAGEDIPADDLDAANLNVAKTASGVAMYATALATAQSKTAAAGVERLKTEWKLATRTAVRAWAPVGEHEQALQELADEFWAQLQRTQAAFNEQIDAQRQADHLRSQLLGQGGPPTYVTTDNLASVRNLSACLTTPILMALVDGVPHADIGRRGREHIERAKAAK